MASRCLVILGSSATIFFLGLIMIFSTTSAEVLELDLQQSTHYPLVKQILYGVMGAVLGFLLYRVGHKKLLEISFPLVIFFVFLLALTLVPGIGKEVNGSKRWLSLAGITIQPSEFVKYLVPFYFIHQFSQKEISNWKAFIKNVAFLTVPIILILVEPNNGTALVMVITLIMLCFLMEIAFRYWAWPLIIFLLLGSLFAYQLPYVNARLRVYWHPELDLQGRGHQPYQAKIAAGSGKLWGRGPGNSLQKLSYLPEAQNDYIAAIFAEEFGFFGIVCLISLYAIFIYQGFSLAFCCKEKMSMCLAATVTFLISFQAFLNLGVVSGILPSTGLNLPLFSQGGSSLIANIMGLSLLLRVD